MHEGSVMQTVVTTLLAELEKSGGGRVARVQLELGIAEHFTEEAVRQYFQVLTRNTPAEGAWLELAWLPATCQCLSCLRRFESTSEPGICPACGEVGLEIAHQDACAIRAIDVITAQ